MSKRTVGTPIPVQLGVAIVSFGQGFLVGSLTYSITIIASTSARWLPTAAATLLGVATVALVGYPFIRLAIEGWGLPGYGIRERTLVRLGSALGLGFWIVVPVGQQWGDPTWLTYTIGLALDVMIVSLVRRMRPPSPDSAKRRMGVTIAFYGALALTFFIAGLLVLWLR